MRIVETRSEHLESTTHTDNRSSLSCHPCDHCLQPVLADPFEITHRILCSGYDNEIGSCQFFRPAHIGKSDSRKAFKGIEVREVRDPRKSYHRNLCKRLMSGSVEQWP